MSLLPHREKDARVEGRDSLIGEAILHGLPHAVGHMRALIASAR